MVTKELVGRLSFRAFDLRSELEACRGRAPPFSWGVWWGGVGVEVTSCMMMMVIKFVCGDISTFYPFCKLKCSTPKVGE